jgi:hypothetical protein
MAERPEEVMSQFAWETETTEGQVESSEPIRAAATVALSTDDFAALEERVIRAVDLVKRERKARAAAEERASAAEAQLREQAPIVERAPQLESEVAELRAERESVRQRVERLLAQLDVLEL